MDAVKIMTIHASKGLEFPLVFVPGLEEKFTLKTNDSLIYESDGKFFFKYRPESAIRRLDEDFLVNQQKEEEEQKRLFYVAVTRAEEALFLVGRWSENNNGFLGFLKQGIGLQRIEEKTINAAASNALTRCEHICWEVETQLQGLSILSEEDVNAMNEGASKPAQHRGPVAIPAEVISLNIKEEPQWKAVTDATNIRRRHGKDWVILGDIMHRLFEGISKGVIAGNDIKKKAGALFACERIVGEERERLFSIIDKDISLLMERGIWNDIILPRENSYSELPFILEYENVIYSGRIDRVIKEDNIYNIYDYKTFPVDEKEIEYLLKEYSFQLGIYKKAVIKLFNAKKVGSFIVFSNRGEVREVAC